MTYITLDEAQRWVGQASTADLADLEDVLSAVCASIDAHCSRSFALVEGEDRDFVVHPGTPWVLDLGPYNDLVAVDSLKVDDGTGTFATTLTASDYQLEPRNRSGPETRPYTSVRRLDTSWPLPTGAAERQATVRISGDWGWPAVPEPIKAATRIQTARLFKRADSPLGVAGFGEFGVVRVSALDPDVRALLAPYRIPSGIA